MLSNFGARLQYPCRCIETPPNCCDYIICTQWLLKVPTFSMLTKVQPEQALGRQAFITTQSTPPPLQAAVEHGAGRKGTLRVDIQGNAAAAVAVVAAKGLPPERALGRVGRRGAANMAPKAAAGVAGRAVVWFEELCRLPPVRLVDHIAALTAGGWGKVKW